MVKAHIVNHTHWDREWYFTVMDSQVLADQVFTDVLNELETHPKANFTLDGQTSILDEYVMTHPENLDRIKKLVANGQLFVGPWYTQTDALIPDAESILRNLKIGIEEAEAKYGKVMKVGYLPDTFGFNAQMPMLLNQAGIDSIIFWRGTNFDFQVSSPYFKWHGLSGDEVTAANFPFGYFMGQIGLDAKEKMSSFIKDRYDAGIKFLSEHGNNEDVLMPSGIDQMNIVHDMSETVEKINKVSKYETQISNYQEVIDLLKTKNLPDLTGELRLPTYSRVHRTIGSVRQSIKTMNFEAEQKIIKRVEPLMVIAQSVGIDIGKGMLNLLWKKLLENQAHDSLGGSVSDNVAEDINHRFKEIDELADGIENYIKKKMADYLDLKENEVMVFNTDAHEFSGTKQVSVMSRSKNITFSGSKVQSVKVNKHYPVREHVLRMTEKGREYFDEPEYFDLLCEIEIDLPAFGYKIITFKPTEQENSVKESSGNSISLKDKTFEFKNGRIMFNSPEFKSDNFVSLVDSANDGDTYDYSPVANGQEIDLPLSESSVISDDLFDTLIVSGTTNLPKDLDTKELSKVEYSISIVINKADETFTVKVNFNNTVNSHRLRVKIDPGFNIEKVRSGIQGGIVDVINQDIDPKWEDNFDEKPVNIYNFDKLLEINNGSSSLSLYPKGLKEFEYNQDGLFVTLLATTGQLGKPNLAWRPGRASGDTTNEGHIMMPTPLAQEIGEWEFEIGLEVQTEVPNKEELSQSINKFFDASISYQKQTLNLFINRLDNKIWSTEIVADIPRELSLLTLPEELIVSSIAPSKDDDSYLVRILNPTDETIEVPAEAFADFTEVDILEEKVEQNHKIGPSTFKTFKSIIPVNFERRYLEL